MALSTGAAGMFCIFKGGIMYFTLQKRMLLSLALGCSSILMATNESTGLTQLPEYKGSCSVMDAIFLSNRNSDAKLSELYSNCPEALKDLTVNSISTLLGGNLNKTLEEALSVLTPIHPVDPQVKHVTQSLAVINGLDENVNQLLKALSAYQSKSYMKGELVFAEIASQFGQKSAKDFRDALLNLGAVRQAVGRTEMNGWLLRHRLLVEPITRLPSGREIDFTRSQVARRNTLNTTQKSISNWTQINLTRLLTTKVFSALFMNSEVGLMSWAAFKMFLTEWMCKKPSTSKLLTRLEIS